MKSLLFSLVCLIFFHSSSAQMPGGFSKGQKPDSAAIANMPKTGKIFGLVVDAITNQPVEYATVVVRSIRDSAIVGGAISTEKGKFTVTELPAFGRFKLEVTFIGYQTMTSQPIMLSPQNPMADVGIIKITQNAKYLKDVNITAEKSDFQNSIAHKVYNVDKNLINTGGTATEVLQNIPSVTVDIDGNVALRGSANVTVYIDGKPSGITGASRQAVLQQIPASAIEQIEVITNPSAKYDAEGMAGIINIKTKKGKLKGMNGNISFGAGTNHKYNSSLGFNNRTDRFNFYGNYSFRSEQRESNGNGFQTNIIPSRTYTLKTTSSGSQQNTFHTGKMGMESSLNNYNTLGLNASYTSRIEDRPENSISFTNNPDPIIDNTIIRNNTSKEDNGTLDGSLDYKKTFKNSKRELTASSSYSYNKSEDVKNFKDNINDFGDKPYQRNIINGKFTAFVIQSDYVHPLSKSKIEAGLKASVRINDNIVDATVFDGTSSYVNDVRYSDHFIYEENIYAAYALFSGKVKSFDYSAGLRTEQTLTNGDSKTTSIQTNNDYLSFFPSASIKYNWKATNEVQLSYSRRTNRPRLQSLNPITDYSDTLNLRTGNPFLLPEFIHSLELAYMKTLDNVSLSGSIYYRHIDDVISRFRFLDTLTGVSTMKMVNLNTADNIGIETVIRYQLGKSGNLMWSFNLFRNKLNGENITADLQGSNTNWNTRLTASYRLLKNLSFQLSGMYGAPDKQPTRVMRGMMNAVDAGMKFEFMKGKASLNFNVTDIFDTREFDIHIEQEFYVYDGVRKRESRVAMLTFNYRFGNQDTAGQRKRNSRNPVQEGAGENNDGGGGF